MAGNRPHYKLEAWKEAMALVYLTRIRRLGTGIKAGSRPPKESWQFVEKCTAVT